MKTFTFSKPFLAFETTQHGSSINQSVCLSEFSTPQDSVPKGQVATQESNHKCEKNPRMSKASISKNQALGRATICKLGFLWVITQKVSFWVYRSSTFRTHPIYPPNTCKGDLSYFKEIQLCIYRPLGHHANILDQIWRGHVGHCGNWILLRDKTEALSQVNQPANEAWRKVEKRRWVLGHECQVKPSRADALQSSCHQEGALW